MTSLDSIRCSRCAWPWPHSWTPTCSAGTRTAGANGAATQAETLRRLGCDELQGFWIRESVTLGELEALASGALVKKAKLGVIPLASTPRGER